MLSMLWFDGVIKTITLFWLPYPIFSDGEHN